MGKARPLKVHAGEKAAGEINEENGLEVRKDSSPPRARNKRGRGRGRERGQWGDLDMTEISTVVNGLHVADLLRFSFGFRFY